MSREVVEDQQRGGRERGEPDRVKDKVGSKLRGKDKRIVTAEV